jgi:hypothetical protein
LQALGGGWYFYYDNKLWANSSRIAIDFGVGLAEAWESGARFWSTERRTAYANDLGDRRTLVGVTDTMHSAKASKDPAEWLPPVSSARCRYVRSWVAIKIRWWLTVDQAEKNKLVSLGNGCPNDPLTVVRTTKPGARSVPISIVAGGLDRGPATDVSIVPRSIAISGYTLYVTDVYTVRKVDLVTGKAPPSRTTS